MSAKPLLVSLVVAVVALATPTARVDAATDYKFVSAHDCIAFTPNTQPSELQVSASGLYNAGTTGERVICPLPRDQDDGYLVNDVDITVYYRGLGAPGRVTCTLFVGSAYMQAAAIYSTTTVGNLAGNGEREALVLYGANQDDEFITTPANVVCALDPKMALAGLFFNESGPTNVP
jgi:hypothetical protein